MEDRISRRKKLNCLYVNDGKGNFKLKEGHASVFVNASCIKPADVDNDGDQDVFIGGRVIPGHTRLQAYLLINDGKGNFTTRLQPWHLVCKCRHGNRRFMD